MALPLVAIGLAAKGISKLKGKKGKKALGKLSKFSRKKGKGFKLPFGKARGVGRSRGTKTLRKRYRRAARQLNRIAFKKKVLAIERRVQRAKMRYLSI